MFTIRRLFRSAQPVPPEHRRNFLHLYFDIAWWGVLNGSLLIFLAIYASRLGASTFQLGLLTASPALVNLLFTFPAGALIRSTQTAQSTRWSALIMRLFYFLIIPLPLFLPPEIQIWSILAITLVMNIPGTMIAIAFNAFFAESVPPQWRGQVAGTRNALFSITTMGTALIVGLLLDHLPFEVGYTVVFAIGAVGSMMSTIHLWLVRLPPNETIQKPAMLPAEVRDMLYKVNHAPLKASRLKGLRLDVIRGAFGRLLGLIIVYHIAIFLISPVVPKYQVDTLLVSDGLISLGTVLFWVAHFFGSLQSRQLAGRWGFQRMTGYGTMVITISLLIFIYSFQTWVYLLHAFIGGLGWSLISGGLMNFILERIPVDDRPPYLAWYNLAINAAVLLCGLLAPLIAGTIGMVATLLVAVALRMIVGLVLLRKP